MTSVGLSLFNWEEISRKLLKMNVLAFETSWAKINQVTSVGLSLFNWEEISRKLLKMNVLAFETCWKKNKAIDTSWSIFTQLSFYSRLQIMQSNIYFNNTKFNNNYQIPHSRFLLKKLKVPWPVKEFPLFYGIVTVLKRNRKISGSLKFNMTNLYFIAVADQIHSFILPPPSCYMSHPSPFIPS